MKKGLTSKGSAPLHFSRVFMAYCGDRTIVKRVDRERRAISLRCRSWTCPDCADLRKRMLIAQCIGGAPNTFLTLTSRRTSTQTANQAALALTRAWRIVRLRIMRQRGFKRLPFQAVMEATKNGWPHLHILLRSIWIDQKWLSAQMAELIDSPNVWIERIDRKARVAGYVAKYAGKCAHKFGTAKRYWRSRDFDLRPPPEKPYTWKGDPFIEVVPTSLINWIATYTSQGWTVVRTSQWAATARPPPLEKATPRLPTPS